MAAIVRLKDASVAHATATLGMSSSKSLTSQNLMVSDKDIIFKGNDGGSGQSRHLTLRYVCGWSCSI